MMLATDSRERLFEDARAHDAAPLWTVMEAMVPPHPEPKALPQVWRYDVMRPLLARAGALVDEDEAERRVFMLVNRGIKPPYTTDTLYAGLQLIQPGEVARAHRHVAFALRFIIEGTGAYTAVGGEKIPMAPGDLVLTPSWTWHDHGSDGDAPMVWLDGLDLPLYQAIPVNFAQPFPQERTPSVLAGATSPLRYAWQDMKARLDAVPGSFALEEYRHRETGAPVSRVIGACAERVVAGTASPPRRETTSCIYHVIDGSGETRVGDIVLQWRRGDTFALPAWQPFTHQAAEDVYLFRFDDRPLLDAIGGYRNESADSAR